MKNRQLSFCKNPDQVDSDADGIWDACDTNSQGQEMDTDGDGINDEDDSCPNIPENTNGVEDEDGCPEIEYTFSF